MRSGFLGGGIGPRAFGGGVPADPVPVAGAELLTNGDFAAWTGGNPDGWNIAGESGSDPAVSEVAGGARFYSSASNDLILFQTIPYVGWLRIAATYVAAVGQPIALRDGSIIYSNFASTQPITALWSNAWMGIYGLSPVDITYSLASAVPLTLSSIISTRACASPDCDISAAVTRTAGTQAGLCARLDSASSPANFIIAYENGAGLVKVDKCVSGTYTNVIDAAITYVAGRVLRLVCSGNDVSCYYNGVQVGTTVTVADAGIVSNKNHGKFSTYASNTLANYVAA